MRADARRAFINAWARRLEAVRGVLPLMTFLHFSQLEVDLPPKGPDNQGHGRTLRTGEGLFDTPT